MANAHGSNPENPYTCSPVVSGRRLITWSSIILKMANWEIILGIRTFYLIATVSSDLLGLFRSPGERCGHQGFECRDRKTNLEPEAKAWERRVGVRALAESGGFSKRVCCCCLSFGIATDASGFRYMRDVFCGVFWESWGLSCMESIYTHLISCLPRIKCSEDRNKLQKK